MAARNYRSVARATTLTSGVSGGATAFAVTETTGFPTVPYTLVVDPGRAEEEAVTVTNQVGLNLTVLRGQDGTGAQAHDAGATLRHMATARDFREPAEHIDLVSGVHGVGSDFVGSTDSQTLDNKTFQASLTDHTPIVVKAASGQTTPVLVFSDAAGATVAAVNTAGRVNTPGVDSSSSSTLTAGSAATVPLIVKGAASQSAKLLSVRDSGNTERVSADASGVLVAAVINSTDVTASNVTATSSTVLSTSTDTVPLVVKTSAASTTNALSVRDSTNVSRAGVLGDSSGYQLFHGATTNKVPFKIHAGSQNVTMLTGASSQSGSIDITSFGFDTAPLVQLTVRQENESSVKRRVFANIEGSPTTSAITFRVVQSADQTLPDDTLYRVHWLAVQVGTATAAG